MAPKEVTTIWDAYAPAMEAWQAFLVNSMTGLGRASMMWAMIPLNIGWKLQARPSEETGVRHLQSLIEHAVDTHKHAEVFTSRAYASSLDAGYRSFRAFEAAALDCGTYDESARRATENGPRRAA